MAASEKGWLVMGDGIGMRYCRSGDAMAWIYFAPSRRILGSEIRIQWSEMPVKPKGSLYPSEVEVAHLIYQKHFDEIWEYIDRVGIEEKKQERERVKYLQSFQFVEPAPEQIVWTSKPPELSELLAKAKQGLGKNADPEFVRRICGNILRHEYTNYDSLMDKVPYTLLRQDVDALIDKQYPNF